VAVRGLAWAILGFRVRGQENVPPAGPLLVVANHLHNFDPVMLSAAVPRPIFYMGKRELFTHPVMGFISRNVGAFPVNRQAIDRAALRHIGLLLDEGLAVGILPEGTRSPTHTLTTGHPGVALVAAQRAVPILPVAITGTEYLPFDAKAAKGRWLGGRITVTIGRPFLLPPRQPGVRADLAGATDRIMIEIAALLPPEYRGVYAERLESEARG
jgi:1-acyl-sn-glycerol-3-phosphate acyltransferase